MKCPVCKTELNTFEKCNTCGFADLRTEFLSEDEANDWIENIVIPYKNSYYSDNTLVSVDWLNVFKENTNAKALFEVTIPVAFKKCSSLYNEFEITSTGYIETTPDQRLKLIESILGHIILVSDNDLIQKQFISEVAKEIGKISDNIKTIIFDKDLKASDLAAFLTNLQSGNLFVCKLCEKANRETVEIFKQALNKYTLDIIIGKGPTARSIQLELPVFTAIVIVDNANHKTFEAIKECVDTIIIPEFSSDKLLEYQICETAKKFNILLTPSTLALFKENLKYDNIRNILKFVSDYLFLYPEINQPVTFDEMRTILKKVCI